MSKVILSPIFVTNMCKCISTHSLWELLSQISPFLVYIVRLFKLSQKEFFSFTIEIKVINLIFLHNMKVIYRKGWKKKFAEGSRSSKWPSITLWSPWRHPWWLGRGHAQGGDYAPVDDLLPLHPPGLLSFGGPVKGSSTEPIIALWLPEGFHGCRICRHTRGGEHDCLLRLPL